MTTNNNNEPSAPGFRLHRLEVRNWGTFDEKVHVLDPSGTTALLIGENGSGKSTLVDALLTLMVPRAKRSYNVSAGSIRKRERDEKSYVLGAYASESSSEEARAQTKFLRKPGGAPTILLACFENQATGECVTIAQMLWVQEDEVKKLFLISRRSRSIASDFSGLQDSRTWKKALRHRGFEVDETFNDYAEKIVGYLKMESITTLTLFNQTVAIKEITHVSTFIREHMLERLDTKELMDRLEQHYEDLTRCWDAIQRARTQLELLQPVADRSAAIDRLDAELREVRKFRELLPACFAARLKVLLEVEMASLQNTISELDNEIVTLGEKLVRMREDEFSIQQALDNDEVGQQLRKVEEELSQTIKEETRRRELGQEYHSSLHELGLVEEVLQERTFLEQQTWAEREHSLQTAQINVAASAMALASQTGKELGVKIDELNRELRSLKSRPDLIPEQHRQMRDFIARGAGVSSDDLPFAGELMDVRERYSADWRGALERLLRGFGLSILVPDRIYTRVNHFINDNNLRRRVVYHHVPQYVPQPSRGSDQGRVIEKLALKSGHPLVLWLEAELRNQFNHRCCETVEEFERLSGFAITKQGLIRSGGSRHIKDDSRDITDAQFYILGWRNLDKVQRLEEQLATLVSDSRLQERAYSAAQTQQEVAHSRARLCAKLTGFRVFAEIDWRSKAEHRNQLQVRKQKLERSSNQVRQLQQQLSSVRSDITALDNQKTQLAGRRGGFQTEYLQCQARQTQCLTILAATVSSDLQACERQFEQLISGRVLSIGNSERTQLAAEGTVADEILDLTKKRENEAKVATKFMERYLGQFADAKADLAADERYLQEFLKLRDAIAADDLPRHEERFKDLMSHDVLAHVASFQDKLETHCEEIEAKVNHLNEALRSIEYSPRTYIRIRVAPSIDPDIRDFRHRLRACLEFGLSADAAARESAFRRISELITRFREKPDWAVKVTDTRVWLVFAVEELRRDDDAQENFYSDTGGKSGGQKAKLAFTILASAIAYQYGIARSRANPDSFRFVVIDEMFARSDETNARYALQLFATFHLQLLIVCPLDARARVVEPFVSSYHLALNPTTQESTVRTITVEEIGRRLAANPLLTKAHAVT
jgi:uncharacterized protein YPO0396